jgi:hypothetical protein
MSCSFLNSGTLIVTMLLKRIRFKIFLKSLWARNVDAPGPGNNNTCNYFWYHLTHITQNQTQKHEVKIIQIASVSTQEPKDY